MKRLLLILGFLIYATAASAQNITCSDRPAGTSSNACANTRFVGSAVTTGIAAVPFTATGTGAVATTLQSLARWQGLNALNFMTDAQRTDVRNRVGSLDVSAALANWFTACKTQKVPCYAPAGVYKIDSQQLWDLAGATTDGISIVGDGRGATVFNAQAVASAPAFQLYASGGTPSSAASTVYSKIIGISIQCNLSGPCFRNGQLDGSDAMNEQIFDMSGQNFSTNTAATVYEFTSTYSGLFYINGATAALPGEILTRGAITGGSLYTNGTYTNVPLTGGTGTAAYATIVVSGGAVTNVTITSPGYYYTSGNSLSALAANIGGTGSGFAVAITTARSGNSTVIRVNSSGFNKWFIGGSSANSTIHLTNAGTSPAAGFNNGNTFYGMDCEIVAICARIDAGGTSGNSWYGGTWAYGSYGFDASAGSNNIAFVPAINANTANFLSSGSANLAYQFSNVNVVPDSSLTKAATVQTLLNSSNAGFFIMEQTGAGIMQFKVASVVQASIDSNGLNTRGVFGSGSVPTISACGTSPSVTANSTKMSGAFTTGTGSPTACTITFDVAYPSFASCTISPANAVASGATLLPYISAQSNSAFTVTFAVAANSAKYAYQCGGK